MSFERADGGGSEFPGCSQHLLPRAHALSVARVPQLCDGKEKPGAGHGRWLCRGPASCLPIDALPSRSSWHPVASHTPSWGLLCSVLTGSQCCAVCLKVAKGEGLKNSHPGKTNLNYVGDGCVNSLWGSLHHVTNAQFLTLYVLNLYNVICHYISVVLVKEKHGNSIFILEKETQRAEDGQGLGPG